MLPSQGAEGPRRRKASSLLATVIDRAKRKRLSDDRQGNAGEEIEDKQKLPLTADSNIDVEMVPAAISEPEEIVAGRESEQSTSYWLEHRETPLGEPLKSASKFPQTRPLIISIPNSYPGSTSSSPLSSSAESSSPTMLGEETEGSGLKIKLSLPRASASSKTRMDDDDQTLMDRHSDEGGKQWN
ncbi:hypothetical protein IAR50_006776 [Cryptococcus sp. DSM 104548]